LLAVGAEDGLAGAAIVKARLAAQSVAAIAGRQAVPAQGGQAAVADVLVVADQVSTPVAGDARPIGKRDEGTSRVVGVQNAVHELEEIK
jgi:hypothetical protein